MASQIQGQKITPFLWYDTQAEEAAKFYTGIFKNSKITSTSRYGEGAPMPAGTVLTVSFELDGQKFMAMNAGPQFPFTEAISFMINCDTQDEIDYFWEKLTEGGKEVQCGWLKDKYGLSWQVVPSMMGELMSGKEPGKSSRVMQALMKMVKLDIETLKNA
jgi:predicted 3-demethylubiquinone-9 3-methyltransferase (glyoxalase superfamily)